MKAPRIMLAAGRSGSGKTMITCGLLRALQQMGKQPAAFKCGPDYIDPMFHEQVIGARILGTYKGLVFNIFFFATNRVLKVFKLNVRILDSLIII